MIYLYSKYEHYLKFLSENKSDRIHKGVKLITIDNKYSSLCNIKINEEIFENPIECEYDISDIGNDRIKVRFKSKREVDYRIDISKIAEDGQLINHIGFTIDNFKFDKLPTNQMEQDEFDMEYEALTDKNEVYDVLGRIRYILLHMIKNKIINNHFCVGGTVFLKKNKLYEFFLKVIVGDDGFKKKQTDVYPKIGWGLYFTI